MTTPHVRSAEAPHDGAPSPRRVPSRRQLARGAAWAAPTVIAGTAAPAYAASACVVDTSRSLTAQLSFGGAAGANGWTLAGTGAYYGAPASPRWDVDFSLTGGGPSSSCGHPSAEYDEYLSGSGGGVLVGDRDPSVAARPSPPRS